MMTNNNLTTPTTIALRQQGIPADLTLWSDEHFQVYVRKHTLKTMTPPVSDDPHGYWRNKEDGKCYGKVLNQYVLTRSLTTLEQLDDPIPDDMSAFEWVVDPNWKAPDVFFCADNNLTDEEFELIKAQLRESPLFKRMLVDHYTEQGYQVDLVYITGSRLSGICDARSDIDILIICKNQNEKTYFHDEDLLLVWKNKPSVNMHWYLRSWDDIISTNRGGFIQNTSGCYWNSFKEQLQKNILYANPAAQETIDKYINHNDVALRDHLLYKAIAIVLPSLRMFVELDTIPEKNYSKIWYHVCMYSLILQGEKPIDYKKQLLYAKRMRWNGVSPENIKWMMEQIKWVVNWYDRFEDKWETDGTNN